MTRQRLSVRDTSLIERRPPHLYECSWRHYQLERGTGGILKRFFSLFELFAGRDDPRHEPSPLLATVTDRVRDWTCMEARFRSVWFFIRVRVLFGKVLHPRSGPRRDTRGLLGVSTMYPVLILLAVSFTAFCLRLAFIGMLG